MLTMHHDNDPRAGVSLVIGLGETGYACACHLARQGRQVVVADTRAQPPRAAALSAIHPEIEQITGPLDAALLRGAAEIVISPGVDPRQPAIEQARTAGVAVAGEIELFARVVAAPVVAITGSNGKSTVTTLLGEMAQAAGENVAVGGNLGTPALTLLETRPDASLYILELSSFQLETVTSLAPIAAVVLNLSIDHLDRYADFAEYAATKARIYQQASVAVVNRDAPEIVAMAASGASVRGFTLARPQGSDWGINEGAFVRGAEQFCSLAALTLPGSHSQANALAALALGDAIGLPWASMEQALREFRGLAHRMELVAERQGRRFYNDSKGTNVGATAAAVAGLDRPVVLIAGGQGKGQDFTLLAAALRGRVRAAVLIGEDAPALAAALAGVCPCESAPDMSTALARALAASAVGDAIVLSPACASFDMFPNYAARGDAFRRCVEVLGDD